MKRPSTVPEELPPAEGIDPETDAKLLQLAGLLIDEFLTLNSIKDDEDKL